MLILALTGISNKYTFLFTFIYIEQKTLKFHQSLGKFVVVTKNNITLVPVNDGRTKYDRKITLIKLCSTSVYS